MTRRPTSIEIYVAQAAKCPQHETVEDIDACIRAIEFWIRVAWFALISGLACGWMIGWGMRVR